jgi:hypothetical protein
MPYPENYKDIAAHKHSIQKARGVKEDLGLTWNEFLEHGAIELAKNNE